jgi:hypothetical protein
MLVNRRTNESPEDGFLSPGDMYFFYLRHQARFDGGNGCAKSYIGIDESLCSGQGAVNAPLVFREAENALRIKFTLG